YAPCGDRGSESPPRPPGQERGIAMASITKHAIWIAVAVVGAFALGSVALSRGETINALWIMIAAVSIYLVAYRYYALYLARTVVGADPTRMTPAVRYNDRSEERRVGKECRTRWSAEQSKRNMT